MAEIILGMLGAILAIAAYKGGFYIGQKSVEAEKKESVAVQVDEEELRKREQLIKDINRVFNYKRGGKK